MWKGTVQNREEQKTDFSRCALCSFDSGITSYINNINKSSKKKTLKFENEWKQMNLTRNPVDGIRTQKR